MKKIQCPCCRNFTDTSDYYLFEICQVCFWQYEESANDKPNILPAKSKNVILGK